MSEEYTSRGYLVNVPGNPWVKNFNPYPYPYPLKPLPPLKGRGSDWVRVGGIRGTTGTKTLKGLCYRYSIYLH